MNHEGDLYLTKKRACFHPHTQLLVISHGQLDEFRQYLPTAIHFYITQAPTCYFGCLCYILDMSSSKYDTVIQGFAEMPVFTAAEARTAGIPSRMLSHFCKKGIIERVRGCPKTLILL